MFYGYDAGGRVQQVTAAAGTVYASHFTYHPSGAIAGYQLGHGVGWSMSLDNRHRPSRIVSGALDLTYGDDAVGNVTSVTDPRPGHSSGFQYDALDRLTVVTGFGAAAFDYDALGNRTWRTGTTFSYDAATQRLQQATGVQPESFGYNAV